MIRVEMLLLLQVLDFSEDIPLDFICQVILELFMQVINQNTVSVTLS